MDDAASRRGTPTTHLVFADDARRGRLGRRVAPLRRRRRHPRRRPRLRAAPTSCCIGAPRRRVGDVERAAHRAERRPVARHPGQRPAAIAPRQGRADLPATRAASTPSNARCTSVPCWPRPSAAAELLPALSAYGLPLGDAFQMRDDVIGAFGDERDHRQAGRRRPARRQAHAAAGPRRRPRRRPRSARCSTGSAPPDLDDRRGRARSNR